MTLSYEKKTWTDTDQSGTPIEADDLNKYETSLSDIVSVVNKIPDIYIGSKVCNIWSSNGQLKLFDEDEYKAITGHNYNIYSDIVYVMNGHFNANQRYLSAVAGYVESNKTYSLWVQTISNVGNEDFRVNYVIMCAK